MKVDDIPEVFVEAFCVHRIFAAAGVKMADVYVIPRCLDPLTGREELGVQARQGDRAFTVTVGPLGMSLREFHDTWREALAAYQTLSDEQARELTDQAAIRDRALLVFAGMSAKGFVMSVPLRWN